MRFYDYFTFPVTAPLQHAPPPAPLAPHTHRGGGGEGVRPGGEAVPRPRGRAAQRRHHCNITLVPLVPPLTHPPTTAPKGPYPLFLILLHGDSLSIPYRLNFKYGPRTSILSCAIETESDLRNRAIFLAVRIKII